MHWPTGRAGIGKATIVSAADAEHAVPSAPHPRFNPDNVRDGNRDTSPQGRQQDVVIPATVVEERPPMSAPPLFELSNSASAVSGRPIPLYDPCGLLAICQLVRAVFRAPVNLVRTPSTILGTLAGDWSLRIGPLLVTLKITFPIPRLRCAKSGLNCLFLLHRASRGQVPWRLCIPSARPCLFGGLRIYNGLGQIGDAVAKFLAGPRRNRLRSRPPNPADMLSVRHSAALRGSGAGYAHRCHAVQPEGHAVQAGATRWHESETS